MKIYVDGHLEGKNKEAVVGYSRLVFDKNEKPINIIYYKEEITSNEAELMAIAHALLYARKGDTIYSDSQWAILAIDGAFNVKEARLKLLATFLRSSVKHAKIELIHVSRDKNLAT